MTMSNGAQRVVLTGLALGAALYFVARALWWTVQPDLPWMLVASIALFVVATLCVILWESSERAALPLPAAVVVLVLVAPIPVLANLALETETRTEPFATWYIGGLGLLAVICTARRRLLLGWALIVILAVSSAIFLGVPVAIQLGLVGSCVWNLVAQLLMWFGDRAGRDAEQLAAVHQRVAAWHESQRARQYERRVRTQFALSTAGPILVRTVQTQGNLDDDERLRARLAEGRLRDELRGASLLSVKVRAVMEEARRRGAVISVFDEGGLDGIDEARRVEIRRELADVVEKATAQRIIIRSRRNETTAVTIVGRASVVSDDAADVELWHEIPRVRRQGANTTT